MAQTWKDIFFWESHKTRRCPLLIEPPQYASYLVASIITSVIKAHPLLFLFTGFTSQKKPSTVNPLAPERPPPVQIAANTRGFQNCYYLSAGRIRVPLRELAFLGVLSFDGKYVIGRESSHSRPHGIFSDQTSTSVQIQIEKEGQHYVGTGQYELTHINAAGLQTTADREPVIQ